MRPCQAFSCGAICGLMTYLFFLLRTEPDLTSRALRSTASIGGYQNLASVETIKNEANRGAQFRNCLPGGTEGFAFRALRVALGIYYVVINVNYLRVAHELASRVFSQINKIVEFNCRPLMAVQDHRPLIKSGCRIFVCVKRIGVCIRLLVIKVFVGQQRRHTECRITWNDSEHCGKICFEQRIFVLPRFGV
jgi:hypothetical protein